MYSLQPNIFTKAKFLPGYLVRIVFNILGFEIQVFNKLGYFVQFLGNVPVHDAVEMKMFLMSSAERHSRDLNIDGI